MFDELIVQVSTQSGWELIAVLLAIAYLVFAIKQSLWCWPCSIGSTAIYTWLFWEVSLPFQMALNVYYFIMALYGWWTWRQLSRDSGTALSSRSLAYHLKWIAILSGIALMLGVGFSHWFTHELLLLDAFVTVFSVFTTYLVTQKVIENWLYWIIIDGAATYLFFDSALYLTCILFFVYLLMAVYGYVNWSKQQVEGLAK
jgi:nicotinamide mononucleotide transporter